MLSAATGIPSRPIAILLNVAQHPTFGLARCELDTKFQKATRLRLERLLL